MKSVLVCLFLLFMSPVFAQKFPSKYRYGSLGFAINAMNYLGELDPSPGLVSPGVKFTRFNFGFSGAYKISPSISFRCMVSYGRIEGSDKENASYNKRDIHRKIRNLSFRNNIWELKVDVVKDIFPNRGKPILRQDFNPYWFIGVAWFYHNPQACLPETMGGKWISLKPLQLEGKNYSLHQIAIPAGIGFRYKLNQRWDLAFEMGWRFTFTDYLDDVSGQYQDREKFGGNEIAIALSDRSMEGLQSDDQLENYVNEYQGYNFKDGYVTVNGYGRSGDQRGDSGRKDWYFVTGFHFTYIMFSKLVKCPPKFRPEWL